VPLESSHKLLGFSIEKLYGSLEGSCCKVLASQS